MEIRCSPQPIRFVVKLQCYVGAKQQYVVYCTHTIQFRWKHVFHLTNFHQVPDCYFASHGSQRVEVIGTLGSLTIKLHESN